MIGEVIKKQGEPGSGGGAEAFKPGVAYVCSKATRVEMRNIAASDWNDAADEMLLTSELNSRVQKPYYHLVLSWHEQEQPTEDQRFAAADHMIKSLGLDEYQIVIGTHDDTPRKHVHILLNTVHPITGKVWSKSNDHARIEKACREIEIMQGWSHDRGRFAFEVNQDGAVELKLNTEAYEKKKADREIGKRPKTSGARKFEKATGFETFEHAMPDALKARFAEAVGSAYDWQSLHMALGEMGLTYYKSGSGARVGILGSKEFAKASAFGSKFSISKMEKSFGPYEDPESSYVNDLKEDHEDKNSISGVVWDEDEKATKASSFKLTLLRRIYCDIHLDPLVSKQIKFVDLQDAPPQITFKDSATVVDHGDKLSTSRSTKETRAAMISMAKAKGWSSISPSGSPDFIRQIALESAQAGLAVHGVPDDVQAQCDAILERLERQQRRIDAEARAAQKGAQEAVQDRDEVIKRNDQERAEKAAQELEATAEARAVMAALGSGRDPVRRAIRTVAREEEARIKADLPDRRTVSNPQPAPDADRGNKAKVRRAAKAFRENDASELDRMREVHIDEVAARGGWSYDRKHRDGHNDRNGTQYRTYTRGSETIKATKKGPVWVWTNNKSGESGSVVDLWLSDNSGKTLGDARKAFREILGTEAPTPAPIAAKKPMVAKDHTAARQAWEAAPYIGEKRTYAEDRGISRKTLQRFKDEARCGAFGGIYFAHRNPQSGDIQGFEQRWEHKGEKNRNRFKAGGIKTLCVFGDQTRATRVFVVESGLDALAAAEIEQRNDTLYVSSGGNFGDKSIEYLKILSDDREVLSAFDDDPAGAEMHAKILNAVPHAQRHTPPKRIDGSDQKCKDWLDVLNAMKAQSKLQPPPPAMPEAHSKALEEESLDDALEALEALEAAEKAHHSEQPKDEPSGPGFG